MNNNSRALKSGIWYTASNFVTKGFVFLITPIFTRLLSKTDYGMFSNYSSWLSTFHTFATLNLCASFISARFDFEKDFDGYVSSTLTLSSMITILWGLVINIFNSFFTKITNLEIRYINIMVAYLVFVSAVEMFQARERYFYNYKVSVVTSITIAFSSAVLSLLFVLCFQNKLMGRILGSALPTIIVGGILYTVLFLRGKTVNVGYWKYSLPISIPYIPHGLSLTLLNSMDKMMITNICGPEYNAIYAVAYTCGMIITLLVTSLNTAFSPWLGEKLNREEYEDIREASKKYVKLFAGMTVGVMLLTPEILLIMGGKNYIDAIYVMPPVAMGCVCQFLYTMFVNVEQFKRKTVGMAFASISAAILNYILNMYFIPIYGYYAAAYTTLASYLWLLIVHILLVKKIGYIRVYPIKYIFGVLGIMGIYMVIINYLYRNSILRYGLVLTYSFLFVVFFLKHRQFIFDIIKEKK